MSNYAVIQINHSQYLVEEGKEYTVPRFDSAIGKYEPRVLAVSVKDKFTVGTPEVAGSKVVLDVTEQGKGEKVVSRIYKAKAKYRKTTGHRKRITRFKVVSIK